VGVSNPPYILLADLPSSKHDWGEKDFSLGENYLGENEITWTKKRKLFIFGRETFL
jgi:hypothetical protein